MYPIIKSRNDTRTYSPLVRVRVYGHVSRFEVGSGVKSWSAKKKQQRKGEKIRNNLAGVAKQFYIARIGRSRPPVSSTSTFHEDDFRKARGLRRNRVVGFGETAWYPQPVSLFPIPSEIFYQTSLLPLFLPYPKHFFLILEIRHLNFT